MTLSLIRPSSLQLSNSLFGENYNLTLNQSIRSLVAETHKEIPNFAQFIDIFYELMQAKIDPPLEPIWVYAALTFRGRGSVDDDHLNKLSIVKELFQLISACSGSCSPSKSIALLAPVVFEVYKVAVELTRSDLSSKREKKVMRETKSLIDMILGFISLCCCKILNVQTDVIDDGDLNLIVPLKDLVVLWMDKNESLESFLPLVNANICREIGERLCDANYLAGVVIVEMFWLKLWLSFRVGIAGVELEKGLTSWVVSSITNFQNIDFFETLVKMLLEPTLPLISLLDSKHEMFLRKVLYDSLILVEYSFLNPERAIHLPAERMKNLAMTRLLVTHEAIELLREDGDQRRAMSYVNAFSSSKLASQITKWIANHIGMEEKASRSSGSSPNTFLRSLLSLENQGIIVFDDRILKSHAKLAVDNSRAEYDHQSSKVEEKEANANRLFYIDYKGEEKEVDEDEDEEQKKMNESLNAAFVGAAQSMKMTENDGKKRKVGGTSDKKKKIKYLKFDLSDNYDSTKEKSPSVCKESLSSESEIEEQLF